MSGLAPVAPLAAAPAQRADRLVVARGTDIHGGAMLQLAQQRALGPLLGVEPGADDALAAGLQPLLDPDSYGAEVIAHGSTRSVVVGFGTTWCMYCVWPAHQPLDVARHDQPAFERVLGGVLARLRPRAVHISDLPPGLVGDRPGALVRAFAAHVDELVCGGLTLPCSSLITPTAKTRCLLARMERRAITHRISDGRRLSPASPRADGRRQPHEPQHHRHRRTRRP